MNYLDSNARIEALGGNGKGKGFGGSGGVIYFDDNVSGYFKANAEGGKGGKLYE